MTVRSLGRSPSRLFTDLDTGTTLDIVDGRRGRTERDWIGARPRWWLNRVELVAMDLPPSSAGPSAKLCHRSDHGGPLARGGAGEPAGHRGLASPR